MPLVAAAVCPHPPLVVPALAGAAAPELDELRAACGTAVRQVLAAAPDIVYVVGVGPETRGFGPSAYGTLRPYGLDWQVHLHKVSCAGPPGLPLSLQIGAWLMHRESAGCLRLGQAVAPDEAPERCAAIGAALAQGWWPTPQSATPRSVVGDNAAPQSATPRPDVTQPEITRPAILGGAGDGPEDENDPEHRIALLVMGDGSACRGEKAPGYADPRAEPYDEGVAAALAAADAEALLALDPALSAELMVGGRAPWQVLAGAVRAAGGDWRGTLDHHEAPYGVGYLVAHWTSA